MEVRGNAYHVCPALNPNSGYKAVTCESRPGRTATSSAHVDTANTAGSFNIKKGIKTRKESSIHANHENTADTAAGQKRKLHTATEMPLILMSLTDCAGADSIGPASNWASASRSEGWAGGWAGGRYAIRGVFLISFTSDIMCARCGYAPEKAKETRSLELPIAPAAHARGVAYGSSKVASHQTALDLSRRLAITAHFAYQSKHRSVWGPETQWVARGKGRNI